MKSTTKRPDVVWHTFKRKPQEGRDVWVAGACGDVYVSQFFASSFRSLYAQRAFAHCKWAYIVAPKHPTLTRIILPPYMKKGWKPKPVFVNGTLYDKVVEDAKGKITLASSKHSNVFITTLEELNEQYGFRQAYAVIVALGRRK